MNRSPEIAEIDNLKMWAHTNKGERVHDCEFGLDARRYLFDPISLTKEVLISNGRSQLKKYFPYLIVEDFQILSQEDDKSLDLNSIRILLIARFANGQNKIKLDEVITA